MRLRVISAGDTFGVNGSAAPLACASKGATSDEQPEKRKLFIRTMTSGKHTIAFDPDMTIDGVKELIYEEMGSLPQDQRVIFAGKQLDDWHTLSYYNVKQGCILHINERLRGC